MFHARIYWNEKSPKHDKGRCNSGLRSLVLAGYIELWLKALKGASQKREIYAGPLGAKLQSDDIVQTPSPKILCLDSYIRDGIPPEGCAGGSHESVGRAGIPAIEALPHLIQINIERPRLDSDAPDIDQGRAIEKIEERFTLWASRIQEVTSNEGDLFSWLLIKGRVLPCLFLQQSPLLHKSGQGCRTALSASDKVSSQA